jgi:hypothetical protein
VNPCLDAPSVPSCVKPPRQCAAFIADAYAALARDVLPQGVRMARRRLVWPGYSREDIDTSFDARPDLWNAVNALLVRLGRSRVAGPYAVFVESSSPRERARRTVDRARQRIEARRARAARPVKTAVRPAKPIEPPVPVRTRNPVRRSAKRTKTTDDGDGLPAWVFLAYNGLPHWMNQ